MIETAQARYRIDILSWASGRWKEFDTRATPGAAYELAFKALRLYPDCAVRIYDLHVDVEIQTFGDASYALGGAS